MTVLSSVLSMYCIHPCLFRRDQSDFRLFGVDHNLQQLSLSAVYCTTI